VVALKGGSTHIAAPDGRCWINESGCVGLGTSGSGDTLAGLVAGLLARGAEPAQALLWGVYVHAQAGARLAGRIGELGFLARELPGEMPGVLDELAD
jgi:NAD(P)H-hydrate repair Nnr-like enzyme with NAD(P)H-hydrate dehydratase domain